MSGRDNIDAALAREAASQAARVRASALVELSTGSLTVEDLICRCTTSENKALLKLHIDDVVCAAYGLSPRGRHQVIARLRRYTNVPAGVYDGALTLGWLLKNNGRNPHAMGHRLAALYDALDPSTKTRIARSGLVHYPFAVGPNLEAAWSDGGGTS